MTDDVDITCEVLVLGGGPAGLSAATGLARQVPGRVLVLEREAHAGGIPRHCDHLGFGIRDLRRCVTGPDYARRLVGAARRAGVEIQTHATVTGWSGERTVEVTSPAGRQRIRGRVVVLATGARERPRSARLIPGDRPAGVYTSGQLQNLVHLHHGVPGRRAVVVGAELVSYSVAAMLRQVGCEVVLMTSVHPRPEAPAAVALIGRLALGFEVATRTRVTRVIGTGRVQAIELEATDTGQRRTVACDTVVFTGDWIPDHELARAAGVELDPRTRGPLVDLRQATRTAGVFAVGNLVHPVDTADVAALDGHAVVAHVLRRLAGGSDPAPAGPQILPGNALVWVTPGIYAAGDTPPRNLLLAWPRRHHTLPTVVVTQAGRTLSRRRLPRTAFPGRVLRIPAGVLAGASPGGPEIVVDVD